jgi:hypothetical protein
MPQQTVLVMQEQAGFKSDDFTITDATGVSGSSSMCIQQQQQQHEEEDTLSAPACMHNSPAAALLHAPQPLSLPECYSSKHTTCIPLCIAYTHTHNPFTRHALKLCSCCSCCCCCCCCAGRPIFKLSAALFSIGSKRQLLDAYGSPLLDMERKMLSLHGTWLLLRPSDGMKLAELKSSLMSLTPCELCSACFPAFVVNVPEIIQSC